MSESVWPMTDSSHAPMKSFCELGFNFTLALL